MYSFFVEYYSQSRAMHVQFQSICKFWIRMSSLVVIVFDLKVWPEGPVSERARRTVNKEAVVEFSSPSGRHGPSDVVIFHLAEASLSEGLNYSSKIHVKPRLTRAWGMSVFASHSKHPSRLPHQACLVFHPPFHPSLSCLHCRCSPLIMTLRLCFDTLKPYVCVRKLWNVHRRHFSWPNKGF